MPWTPGPSRRKVLSGRSRPGWPACASQPPWPGSRSVRRTPPPLSSLPPLARPSPLTISSAVTARPVYSPQGQVIADGHSSPQGRSASSEAPAKSRRARARLPPPLSNGVDVHGCRPFKHTEGISPGGLQMSIHDFHSKLMSGKEEGTLFQALRRLKSIERPALAEGTEPGWSYWTDGSDGTDGRGLDRLGGRLRSAVAAPSRGPCSAGRVRPRAQRPPLRLPADALRSASARCYTARQRPASRRFVIHGKDEPFRAEEERPALGRPLPARPRAVPVLPVHQRHEDDGLQPEHGLEGPLRHAVPEPPGTACRSTTSSSLSGRSRTSSTSRPHAVDPRPVRQGRGRPRAHPAPGPGDDAERPRAGRKPESGRRSPRRRSSRSSSGSWARWRSSSCGPKDERWLVLVLFSYVTALWFASGLASRCARATPPSSSICPSGSSSRCRSTCTCSCPSSLLDPAKRLWLLTPLYAATVLATLLDAFLLLGRVPEHLRLDHARRRAVLRGSPGPPPVPPHRAGGQGRQPGDALRHPAGPGAVLPHLRHHAVLDGPAVRACSRTSARSAPGCSPSPCSRSPSCR